MSTLKGALIGLVCTFVLYFIPVVNAFAPFLGGAIGGYVIKEGVVGGIKSGILMGVLMVIPGFILSGLLGAILAEMPVLGALVAGSGIIITILLVMHTAILGTIGAAIGGLIAEKNV